MHEPHGAARLARLLVVFERDEQLPTATRSTRDVAVRDALPDEATDAERVDRWLEHVDPDGRRLAQEVDALISRMSLLVVLTGAALGWLSVMAAFYYDGSARVNVPAVAGVLVGIPLLALVGSWYALIAGGTLTGVAGGLARALGAMAGGRIGVWFRRFYTGDGRVGLEALIQAGDPATAAVRRWLVANWSHRAGTAFYVSALATATAMVVFTDLAFGWSTTLDVDATSVHRLMNLVSTPWAAFWPAASPDLELVRISRFFRLDGSPTTAVEAGRLGGWWGFLLATIAIYGLLPRLVSLLVTARGLDGALGCAAGGAPAARELLARLRKDRVRTTEPHPLDADGGNATTPRRLSTANDSWSDDTTVARPAAPGSVLPQSLETSRAAETFSPVMTSPGMTSSRVAPSGSAELPPTSPATAELTPGPTPGLVRAHAVTGASAVNWSAVPLIDAVLKTAVGATIVAHAGSGMDLESEERLVTRLREEASPVVIVTKAWEPPLLDLMDFIEAITEGEGPDVHVWPVAIDGGAIVAPAERDRGVWERALAGSPAATMTSTVRT
jgi:hypothetical protein